MRRKQKCTKKASWNCPSSPQSEETELVSDVIIGLEYKPLLHNFQTPMEANNSKISQILRSGVGGTLPTCKRSLRRRMARRRKDGKEPSVPCTFSSQGRIKTRGPRKSCDSRNPNSALESQEAGNREGMLDIGLSIGDTTIISVPGNKSSTFLSNSAHKVFSGEKCCESKGKRCVKNGHSELPEGTGEGGQVLAMSSRENKFQKTVHVLQTDCLSSGKWCRSERHDYSGNQKETEEFHTKETVTRKEGLVDMFPDKPCGILPHAESPGNPLKTENLEMLGIERLPADTETMNVDHSKEGNISKCQYSMDIKSANDIFKVDPSQQEESCSRVKGVSEEFSDRAEQDIFTKFSSFLGDDSSVASCPIFSKGEKEFGALELGLVPDTARNESQFLPSKNFLKMNKERKEIHEGVAGSQIPAGLASDRLENSSPNMVRLSENSQDPTLNTNSVQPEVNLTVGDSVAENETASNADSSVGKQSASCPPMFCASDPFVCLPPLKKAKTETWKLHNNEPAAEKPMIAEVKLAILTPDLEVNLMEPCLQRLGDRRVLGSDSHSLEEVGQKHPDVKELDAPDPQVGEVSGGSADSWCLVDVTQNLQLMGIEDQVSQNGDHAMPHLLAALTSVNHTELAQVQESGKATARNGLYTEPTETGNVYLGRTDTGESQRTSMQMFLHFMSLGIDNRGETGDSEIQAGTPPGLLEQVRNGDVINTGETWTSGAAKDTYAQSVVGVVCRLHGAFHITLGQWELCRLEELETASLDEDQVPSPIPNEESEDCDDAFSCSKKAKLLLRPYSSNLLFKNPLRSAMDIESQGITKEKKQTKKRKEAHRGKRLSSPKVLSAPSEELVRGTALQMLCDILLKRVQESPDLDVQEETVRMVAGNVEREMFALFHSSDLRYKNKYRSLLFNLRDPKNTHLFRQVVLGEITPQCLVLMSPIELAPQELAEWRNTEKKRALEIIEMEQKQMQKNQVIKLTHKGLIEVEQVMDQSFTLEDLGPVLNESTEAENQCVPDPVRASTVQHGNCLLDPDCLICTEHLSPHIQGRSRRKMAATLRRISTPDPKRREDCTSDRAAASMDFQKKQQAEALWEGFIQMFSIKRFGVKAYLVSGCGSLPSQALPDVIESRGCILPETVWEYVDQIWPAESKAMGLIQFSSSSNGGGRDSQAYSMLYSYLNSKQRYGIVKSKKMEVYIIPLPAFQPIPSKLRSLGGPGLETTHSNLLLAVILPQRCPSVPPANIVRSDKLRKRKMVTFQDQIMEKHQVSSPAQESQNTRPEQLLHTQLCSVPADLCPFEEEPLGLGEEQPSHTRLFSGAVSPGRETDHEFSSLLLDLEEYVASDNEAEETSRSGLHDVLQSLSNSLLLIGQQCDLAPEEAPGGPPNMEGPAEFQNVPFDCTLPGLPLNLLDSNSCSSPSPLQLDDLLQYFACLGPVPSHGFSEVPLSGYPSSTAFSLPQHCGGNEDPLQACAESGAEVNYQIPPPPVLQSLHSCAECRGLWQTHLVLPQERCHP